MMIYDKHQQTLNKNDFETPSKNCPVCSAEAWFDCSAWRALGLDQAPQHYFVMRWCDCRLRWLGPFLSQEDYKFLYNDDYFSSTESGGHSCEEKREELLLCYREIVGRFRTLGISKKLLDIGCGRGEFLDILRESGMAGEGLDPSKFAAETAASRGPEVWQGSLAGF